MILVVDDDNAIRLSLKMLLQRAGYEVVSVPGPAEAMDVVRSTAPRLVLLDMNFSRATSGDEGLTLLKQIKIFRPDVPVILMTAWGSIPLAVEGIHAGAFDFITKPWDNRNLLEHVKAALDMAGHNDTDAVGEFDRSGIIGDSPALNKVLDTVRRVARTDASVLIMGENGTGKELIAEAIHRNSLRAGKPFVKVNLGGISQSLFESEMFGHKKGAFTGAVADRTGRFALADGGTIFLDEIGDLDLGSQVKLLRVLQEHTFEVLGDSRPRKVDIRVVCATNADLNKMVAERTFREDLFYRINLITAVLPALRERPEDIPSLVRHFADEYCRSCRRPKAEITPEAMAYLASLPYPGNIRELKNIVERTLIVGGTDVYDRRHFEELYMQLPHDNTVQPVSSEKLEDVERRTIMNMLVKHNYNMSRTAAALGISRQTLYRRMDKFGIDYEV
ncbi:MAG: sigma-54 dependent transcriptional regulator [Muribaculum sp.]